MGPMSRRGGFRVARQPADDADFTRISLPPHILTLLLQSPPAARRTTARGRLGMTRTGHQIGLNMPLDIAVQ